MPIETMTTGQLILLLENYPHDTPVVSTSCYGDRCNTMQAVPLLEVELCGLEETAYSESGYKVTAHADDGLWDEVLCLSTHELED